MISSKVLFFVTAAATAIFIITILAMVAMLVGDPLAPVNVWFNKNGAMVMTVEVIAIGVSGMSAMIADNRETRKEFRERGRGQTPGVRSESRENEPNS